jgi:hypothetical protein
MVIGCYRTNEVDETHSFFSKAVTDLRLRIKDGLPGVFEITDISIGNLDVTATRNSLSDLDSKTLPPISPTPYIGGGRLRILRNRELVPLILQVASHKNAGTIRIHSTLQKRNLE